MPIVKREKPTHECHTPDLSFLNPRAWFWGEGTEWTCRKCGGVYILKETLISRTPYWQEKYTEQF